MNPVTQLRKCYREIIAALPFYDAWRRDESYKNEFGLPEKNRFPAPDNSVFSLYMPKENTLDEHFKKCAASGVIPAVRHDQITHEDLIDALRKNPDVKVILGSGEKKVLYFIEELCNMLEEFPNLYLSTANLCNYRTFPDMVPQKLYKQLLWGTLAPLLDPHAAAGQLALAPISWEDKCAIAGNNLRKLLNMPLAPIPEEVKIEGVKPFIIDAHGHCSFSRSTNRMPTADLKFKDVNDWHNALNDSFVDRFWMIPSVCNRDARNTASEIIADFLKNSDRINYMETYSPGASQECIEKLQKVLPDPRCVGIKIHPPAHKVDAADPSYAPVWDIAEKFGKPIMSHTWAVVDHNPFQSYSTPARFVCHLEKHPDVVFVLGHAGGRPGSIDELFDVCTRFPNTYVDLAGDYFHAGVLDKIVQCPGVDRIIFASDANWIDPSHVLGMLLASDLSDDDLYKILVTNAEKVYCKHLNK